MVAGELLQDAARAGETTAPNSRFTLRGARDDVIKQCFIALVSRFGDQYSDTPVS